MYALQMKIAPRQPYAAISFHETVGRAGADDPGRTSCKRAGLLNLATGQMHILFRAPTKRGLTPEVHWDWAPSGIAVAHTNTVGAKECLQIWHAPSAAIIYQGSREDTRHAWS